jgi:hypothetical protein
MCVGAGVSSGAFPTWDDLARSFIRQDVGPVKGADVAKDLLKRSTLESVIEAARDRLQLDDPSFEKALSDALYAKLRAAAGDWITFSRCLNANGPGEIQPAGWSAYLQTIRAAFPDISALAVASTIVDAVASDHAPEAILTFNAEPLLPSLIHAISSERGARRYLLDKQVGALSQRRGGRIPYYFCHGLLPVPGVPRRRGRSSVDKLVFSETQYLQLGNAAYSWQSAAFYNVCANASAVFVGLSFADPNMRRWLSWMHSGRLAEIVASGGSVPAEDSTNHYWLNCRSGDPAIDGWVESSVAHLGVRLVWLQNWSQVGPTLRGMLGLP